MSSLAQRKPGYAQLLRRPRYAGFVLTVFLSRISVMMFNTAAVVLVLERTGSSALAGATVAAATLPAALSAPLLGAWLDVVHHRRVLIVADHLLSVVGLLAILALAGHAPNWTVPAVAIVYGTTRSLSAGSFQSSLSELAGAQLLDLASKIEATSLNFALVLGPALTGIVVGATSAGVAVEVQAAITLVAAALIAVNPAFEIRPAERADSVAHAVRSGLRALTGERMLVATTCASSLAAVGWGLMMVGYPIYAQRTLHAGVHASGYLWAGIALGSILGTFLWRGRLSLKSVALSDAAVGCSALLWPFGHTLALGIALVTFTGLVEGPAYSGTITLRQRHAPPAVRAQVLTTINAIAFVAISAGSAIGGVVNSFVPLVATFTLLNLVGASICLALARAPLAAARGAPEL